MNEGNLTLHGLNYLGVKTVHFGYGNATTFAVDISPSDTGSGNYTFNADGTSLTINNATLQAMVGGDWTDSGRDANRSITLESVAEVNGTTDWIYTQAPPTITGHNASAHYRRDQGIDINGRIRDFAKVHLVEALKYTGGNKTRAAELLGLASQQTLTNWIKKYDVE